MRTGLVLGLLGALAGISASVYGFFIYLVGGLNGTGNPYVARVGWLLAAFALAVVAGVGGALATRRPQLASLLMVGGSLLGTAAISLFYINTWYALAVPLCLLGAALALNGPRVAPGAAIARWLLLALLAGAAVASYWVVGVLGVAVLAGLFVVAAALQLTRPAWIP